MLQTLSVNDGDILVVSESQPDASFAMGALPPMTDTDNVEPIDSIASRISAWLHGRGLDVLVLETTANVNISHVKVNPKGGA